MKTENTEVLRRRDLNQARSKPEPLCTITMLHNTVAQTACYHSPSSRPISHLRCVLKNIVTMKQDGGHSHDLCIAESYSRGAVFLLLIVLLYQFHTASLIKRLRYGGSRSFRCHVVYDSWFKTTEIVMYCTALISKSQ